MAFSCAAWSTVVCALDFQALISHAINTRQMYRWAAPGIEICSVHIPGLHQLQDSLCPYHINKHPLHVGSIAYPWWENIFSFDPVQQCWLTLVSLEMLLNHHIQLPAHWCKSLSRDPDGSQTAQRNTWKMSCLIQTLVSSFLIQTGNSQVGARPLILIYTQSLLRFCCRWFLLHKF